MQAEHTPGPWEARRLPNAEWVVDAPNGRDDDRFTHHVVVCDLGEADARLIAAAPDLLAAMRGLLAVIADPNRGHASGRYLSIISGSPEFRAIDAAHGAIAAATACPAGNGAEGGSDV